ncbi:DUF6541 family protein [Microbacterium hominis]|uniref:Uncharacterized protein n=1 Tax=Microbacterium hominis TaxID=162426 RepID=A0A0B4DZ61_9MICO|nr:DUF6541 family protein [Microbacterium hominis]KIC59563.1 hypothetical protein RM52_02665 [Microbacterium hominis]
MDFAPLALPVVLTLALLSVLGVPLALAVGLRGFWVVGAAPAFAVTLVAGTAVVASWLHVPWSVLPVVVVTAIVGGVILLLRRRFPGPGESLVPAPAAGAVALVLAVLGAVFVVAWRVLEIIQAPGNISQSFDNIFHLNGIRYILREGDASSLQLGRMTSPDGSLPFYPAAWHAVVSLIVQMSGTTIPVAVNAVVLVVAAVVWPLSAVLLVRTMFGTRPAYTVMAAVAAIGVPAFPFLLMDYGVLYPLQMSLALLPVSIAAALRVFGLSRVSRPAGLPWWILVLFGAVVGMTLAHPGGFVAWLALTVPVVVSAFLRAGRAARSTRRRIVLALGFVVYLVVGAMLVKVLRPPAEARGWPTQMSVGEAVWQALSLSMWYLVPAVVIAAFTVVGVVLAVVSRQPRAVVAVAMYAIAAALFVVVAALPYPSVRDALTGSWYNNLPRLAAILVVATVPLAAYGAGRTWYLLRDRFAPSTDAGSRSGLFWAAGGAVVALAMAVVVQLAGPVSRAVDWAAPSYRLDDASTLLTLDEYRLLQRLPNEVPVDAVIAGSPWTGTSLAFAISDRRVLMPHTLMYISGEMAQINNHLDDARRGDATCAALADLGVDYVLDFGRQEVHPGYHAFPGFEDLANSSSVRLLDEQGAARLYRIVACG